MNQIKPAIAVIAFFATISAYADNPSKKICTIRMSESRVTKIMEPGFMATICPPEGKTIMKTVSDAQLFGWVLLMPTKDEDRMYVTPSETAKPTNVLLTFNDGTEAELLLSAAQPHK